VDEHLGKVNKRNNSVPARMAIGEGEWLDVGDGNGTGGNREVGIDVLLKSSGAI